jgi:O-antigen ligase
MRTLLALTICVLAFVVIFSLNLNFGPGLSIKNLFVYLSALALFMEFVLGQPPKVKMQGVHACFGILIGYTVLTTLVAGNFAGYRNYGILGNIINVKSSFFDWWVLFAVFFYGARSNDDVERLIKLLLIVISIANVATIAQVAGLNVVGRALSGDPGSADGSRVYGVFGHANETGTLIVAFLPAYIAVAESAIGWRRWAWIGGLGFSLITLILSASRGALAGLFIGGFFAAILCHRYLSVRGVVKWVSTIAAVGVPLLIIVGVKYWDVLMVRLFSEANHGGIQDLSSGRTEIWARGLAKMAEHPWSFITGFGWNSWSMFDFDYIPHNQYLSFLFELGLVGLGCFVVILFKSAVVPLSAVRVADESARRYLLACVFGVFILSGSIMFATLFIPWLFIWPYLALSMRYAVNVLADAKSKATPEQSSRAGRSLAAANNAAFAEARTPYHGHRDGGLRRQ